MNHRSAPLPTADSTARDSAALHRACGSANPVERAQGYRNLWHYLVRVTAHVVAALPDADDAAADAAQEALVRIHTRFDDCDNPDAFKGWARRIAANSAIDELRRRRRFVREDEDEEADDRQMDPGQDPAETVVADLSVAGLRLQLAAAPISERSRRAVVGRFLDDLSDEVLAERESSLAGQRVLPSHVQVTRSKDLARLRAHAPLVAMLRGAAEGEGGPPSHAAGKGR